jgi:hypothetical protein
LTLLSDVYETLRARRSPPWPAPTPDLAVVDRDLNHLFSSWFNRGFLVVRRIDWTTPAHILEKIIRYEAVHEIRDWDDCAGVSNPRTGAASRSSTRRSTTSP